MTRGDWIALEDLALVAFEKEASESGDHGRMTEAAQAVCVELLGERMAPFALVRALRAARDRRSAKFANGEVVS